jgi:hypothetical protein
VYFETVSRNDDNMTAKTKPSAIISADNTSSLLMQKGIRGYRYKASENKSDKDRIRIQKRARKLSRVVGIDRHGGVVYAIVAG